MDIKTELLQGELEETIYIEIPEGIAVAVNKQSRSHQPPKACRLQKSIYGLKQSARAWYGRIHNFFQELDFSRSNHDYSLLINYENKL